MAVLGKVSFHSYARCPESPASAGIAISSLFNCRCVFGMLLAFFPMAMIDVVLQLQMYASLV